ncbi:hypothetical protein B0H14DRAFT_2568286 [Mycena olivaceomarginata]|nr:hypothetical protein B0H14DRAFT_2568286 [Mycena olivaceomarginata]
MAACLRPSIASAQLAVARCAYASARSALGRWGMFANHGNGKEKCLQRDSARGRPEGFQGLTYLTHRLELAVSFDARSPNGSCASAGGTGYTELAARRGDTDVEDAEGRLRSGGGKSGEWKIAKSLSNMHVITHTRTNNAHGGDRQHSHQFYRQIR